MGKVQKKANDKHKSSISPALSDFIEKTISLPLAHLPKHLSSFPVRWPFPRGDLYNWIEPLNRFDDILLKLNKTYGLDTGYQTKPFEAIVVLDGSPDVDLAGLKELGFGQDADQFLAQSIIQFSRLLLEKCGNRTLYNSTERVNHLLNTTSLPLLHHALRLTFVLAQRFADRGPQTPGHVQFYHFDLDKLQKLATPVPRVAPRKTPLSPVKTSKSKDKSHPPKLRRAPTMADPNDFRALARQDLPPAGQGASTSSDNGPHLDWSASAAVRVVWSSESVASVSRPATARAPSFGTPATPSTPTPLRHQDVTPSSKDSSYFDPSHTSADQSGIESVDLDASDLKATTIEALLQLYAPKMPSASQYEFLHKLRTAYAILHSAISRNILLYCRLSALAVIAQVYTEEDFNLKYFDGDSNASSRHHLVHQLVELLRDPRSQQKTKCLLHVQTLAIEAICILSRYRHMSADILSALAPNSSHGIMLSVVQKAVADIDHDDDATDNETGDEWRHAAFMMWTVLVTASGQHNTRSTEQFVHKNLIAAYVAALKVLTDKGLRVHVWVLKFLENLFHHFKDGLQVLNSNGAFAVVCDTSERLSQDALVLFNAGKGIPDRWRTPAMDFKVPYMQQYVLRELVSLVKDVSKHQGNHADRALRGFVDSTSLLNAFRIVMSHMDEFGAYTWSEVVTAVCAFLNNEPTSFSVISEAGLISTLLSTVQPVPSTSTEDGEKPAQKISAIPSTPSLKLPPIADAITNLSTSFSAICLTEAGHRQFVESNVLTKFFELFESPQHVKILKETNIVVQLGSTFDELVRHHPGLKDVVISAVITMVARVRYICKIKFQAIGAGPKLWREGNSGLCVDGGIDAVTSNILPQTDDLTLDFPSLVLPNKDILERGPIENSPQGDIEVTATDEDPDGLSALDYARPVVGFLSAFFETHFLCKETMNAGATDLILDFVTLSTLPISDEAFGDSTFMQDLTNLARQMAEEKPHLVLPLLLDRAQYACNFALTDFTCFNPQQMQCYFAQYLDADTDHSEMELDEQAPKHPVQPSGTVVVKGLMTVHSITRVLAEVFTINMFPARAHHHSILTQCNVADILSTLIATLGKLSAACCREEVALLASMPKPWLDATRPGNYSTGNQDVDTILDVSNQRKLTRPDHEEAQDQQISEDLKTVEGSAAFRNLNTLRYLLTETPASISAVFARVGASFSGRKKPETIMRQRLYLVGDSIAHALATQLSPPFMSAAFKDKDESRSMEWRFKYLTIVLSRIYDSLWEESPTMSSGASSQSFIIDCFRQCNGLKLLNDIGTEFFEELKQCQVDKPAVFAANAGLKLCLQLFEDLTRNDLITSPQTSYMRSTDRDRPFYFNPNQLLLELRMGAMPLTRKIWDSEYAEQASGDVVRKLISILMTVLKGDNEENVLQKSDDFPKAKPHDKRRFEVDAGKVKALKEKGYTQDLVEEALYRCNVLPQSTHTTTAEEYCKALQENSRRRRLPPAQDDLKRRGSASSTPVSRITSPPTAMDIVGGMAATLSEDSSQDEDPAETLETGHLDQGSASSHPGLVVQQPSVSPSRNVASAMNINNILNDPPPSLPVIQRWSKESIDAERESIRDQLAERCNNILSNHPALVFDLNELMSAGATKLTEEQARAWWDSATNLLLMSLISQNIDGDVDSATGKKIAASAHLIGLLSNNDAFKTSMLKNLQESVDEIIGFLQVPHQKPAGDEPYPWISPVLLIVEKLLALDAEPSEVSWTAPTDLNHYSEPTLTHNTVIEQSSKVSVFNRLMEILPKVGKDTSMALSIVRVLVILTRDRALSQMQGEKRNLQKLFLMVKQLGGSANARLQSGLMIVLRHIIEDEQTIKRIMSTEITAYFGNRATGRLPDLSSYMRDLTHVALRSPDLFVAVSNEKVKLASWSPGQHGAASSPLTLRADSGKDDTPEDNSSKEQEAETMAPSVEPIPTDIDEIKAQEIKIPVVEHPDGVIHFLLSELLSYRDVEDKEVAPVNTSLGTSDGVNNDASETTPTAPEPSQTTAQPSADQEKANKPRFKADEHPIFMYRCFILHCLTELLYSYNQTKIEFISFSRKADPQAATPSKAKAGVLSYLLNALVSSGYVDKEDSIACRKRMTTSEWAMKVIVGLCAKTGESELGAPSPSRYSPMARHIEDNDTEPALTYVRRFVLDYGIKVFRDSNTTNESAQARYGRLLCLAELFYKLITKPPGPEGSVYSNNNSYKRISRMMLEKNFIAILTSAISDIDLAFPGAKKVVKFILRPLKELTMTATDLSLNHPNEFPQIVDQSTADNISSASSEVSDVDDEREETPDLYRNSVLGMRDPAHQHDSDSDDDDDEDDEMDYDEYDEEMDYEDEGAAALNDGEVVSDEELEDAVDGAGALEGLPGDVPMDIEFVVNHHHHHHHHDEDVDDEDEDSSSDEEDDDSNDDEIDAEDMEIEMADDDDTENDVSAHPNDEEGEDGWEDEDEDGDEDDDIPEDEDEAHFGENMPVVIGNGGPAAHLTELLRELHEADLEDEPRMAGEAANVILQSNDPEEQDDDDDQDDDEEDLDDNDGPDYDQPFDMMLDGPDYDENEEWGWDEPPPPMFRRSRGGRTAGAMPPFFTRRILHGDDMHHHHIIGGGRHHRHAPTGRQAVEDGTNPLLVRPDNLGTDEFDFPSHRTFGVTMPPGGAGRAFPLPILPPGVNGQPPVLAMDGNVGMGGHGAILDAIMGAIQRGDQDFLQNGRLELSMNTPDIRELLRPQIMPTSFVHRQIREDPHRSTQFIPMHTLSRWQEETKILFNNAASVRTHSIQTRVYAILVPSAQQEEKERKEKQEQERKAEEERLAQRQAEEERLQKEAEERLAREKAETEAREQADAEARESTTAAQADVVEEAQGQEENGEAMDDVQAEVAASTDVVETSEGPPRRYTTIRGRQLDITGLDIDVEYLEALPEDIREEVITSQYAARREQAQEQGNDDNAIDQEFLDALPEDIQEEIRAQEAVAQRRRDRERARREAQAAAGGPGQPGDLEPDDFLATLDPDLRRAILAEQPPEILNALNPQHAAEGRAHARSMFFHRMPAARDLQNARARRDAAQRDVKRQLVQLIDKAGVATLLRLMFMPQQGSMKVNLLNILSQMSGNRQTRYEVVSLLLVILKEGSTDVTAIERSLASLSLRAKASGVQKTPQPLRRTLSMQPYSGLSEEITPTIVVQQCLHTLSHICRQNPHVKSLFLREVDVTSANKQKNKGKAKSKETKFTTHPVNDLISLLDRQLIMDHAGCLQSLAALLAAVTSPLGSLMKQERERQKAEQEQATNAKQETIDQTVPPQPAEPGAQGDITMEEASSASEQQGEKQVTTASGSKDGEKEDSEQNPPPPPEKKKPFEPPTIVEQNLKLVTNIFVAPECGNDTFRYTIETLQNLAHIPDTSQTFGKELTKHVHTLSHAICTELDELLPAIKDAQSSTDVQSAAAARFTASASDQVKLLRVLQALDFLSAPKKDSDSPSDVKPKSILTVSYEILGLSPLWTKLSECLSAVEEKGDTISFANILLPLIESLMVVCKHTTLKDTPVQVKETVVTSPVIPTYRDDLEELFFKFTSDHRKILNDIVRQNPKLMQGHFAILVKNSKVLDFDNKRNYFNKQIHSRHHQQRHPQPPLQLNVRREQVFRDSYRALYFKSEDEMKYGKLNIRFNGEEGVDAGGVTREWFQVLARDMFDPNYVLFQPVASDKTTFHPNPLSRINPDHLLYFKFIGRIIGKALHEGRVLDCHFSRAVYKRILGKKPNLKDLESNDVDYYKSLVWILENDITEILTEEFCVIEDEFGEEKVVDLIPDGRNISVTEENKKEYVQALVEYRLTESVKEQLDSFLRGFHDIIPAELIAIFNEQELELLISGLPEIDVDDWKANTEYHNYNPSSQQVVWYWRIVKAMTNEERAKLLQFITGTSKVPLNGFKELEGVSGLTKCNIHKDPSTNRLPTSHTCFNQLDLPAYESFEVMKHNLFTAINLGADYFGFA